MFSALKIKTPPAGSATAQRENSRSQARSGRRGAEITFADQEADASGRGSAQPPERLKEDYARNKLSA